MSSAFKNNFLKLFSGTVVGQLLPIIITPFLTRLYTPSEIGSFAFYYSIIAIVTGIINLKVDQAIVVAKSKFEAQRLYEICQKITKRISLCSFAIILLVYLSGVLYLGFKLPLWWIILPFHFYFLGGIQSNIYLLNKFEKYGIMGKSKVINGVIFAILQVTLFHFDELGLILSCFVAAIINALYLNRTTNSLYKKTFGTFSFSKTDCILLNKYKDFPIYTASNGLLNSLSNNMPMLILGELFDYKVTGFYSWANRIIQTPMGFILSSLQQVFYQTIATAHNEGRNLYPIVISLLKKLILIGIIPYSVMFFFSEQIFGIVFGEEWIEAGKYTKVLIPWFFIMFLNSPLTSLILVLNKQKEYLIFEFLLMFLRVTALLIGYFIFSEAYYSILFYGIAGLAYNIFLTIYLLKIAKNGTN